MASASDAPIGPRDVIEVKVFQDPSLNTKMTVTDDGRITMPLLGKVDVSGLTPTEVETSMKTTAGGQVHQQGRRLRQRSSKQGSKPISVIGAVTRPGRIGITGNITPHSGHHPGGRTRRTATDARSTFCARPRTA